MNTSSIQWHRMYITVRKKWTKARLKTSWGNSRSRSSLYSVRVLRWLCSSSFAGGNTFSLLCLFQSLSAVPLGDILWFWHLPLRSLTSLGFIFTASHNGLSGTPLPHLASEALLNPRGRFPQSFSSCIPHHCRVRATWTILPGDYLPAWGPSP